MRSRRVAARNQRVAFIFIVFVIMAVITVFVLSGSIQAQAASAENSYKYYTSVQVQSGDTLWDIANAYMTAEYTSVNQYMEEVCTINHITADDIHAGQYLTIPYYSSEYIR